MKTTLITIFLLTFYAGAGAQNKFDTSMHGACAVQYIPHILRYWDTGSLVVSYAVYTPGYDSTSPMPYCSGCAMSQGSISIDRQEGYVYSLYDAKAVPQSGFYHINTSSPEDGQTFYCREAVFYNARLVVLKTYEETYEKKVSKDKKYITYEPNILWRETKIDTTYLKQLLK